MNDKRISEGVIQMMALEPYLYTLGLFATTFWTSSLAFLLGNITLWYADTHVLVLTTWTFATLAIFSILMMVVLRIIILSKIDDIRRHIEYTKVANSDMGKQEKST